MNLKNIKIVVFILILFSYNAGITQTKDVTPNSMQVDPYDYKFEKLGVTEILEYKTYEKTTKDSISSNIVRMSYAVKYDSIGKITNFKYDFEINTGNKFNIFQSQDITIKSHLDSSKIFLLRVNDSLFAYNYYEKLYTYNNNSLQSISIFNPSIYRGFIDGVYIKERNNENTCTVKTINESGELIKVEHYLNDKLFSTQEYYYTEFSQNDYTSNLLTKVILKWGEKITETNIRYLF